MVLLAAALLAAPFDAPLIELRRDVLGTVSRAKVVKAAETAQRLAAATDLAGSLSGRALSLRFDLPRLRARAQRHERDRRGDPGFLSDLRFFSWRLDVLRRETESLAREAKALSAEVNDPTQLAAAKSFFAWTRRLERDADWLDTDAGWAALDFRRAGFYFEAGDIERDASGTEAAAVAADKAAEALVDRLKAPPPPPPAA